MMNINASPEIIRLINICEEQIKHIFERYENIALINQLKVIDAFKKYKVSERHFNATTGYGYGDEGREVISKIFAEVFGAEAAIVSPHIMSGTHAISLVLCGLLRPGDTVLSLTGMPYDTLYNTFNGEGSLKEYGINFITIGLTSDSKIDIQAIDNIDKNVKVFYIQRSTGYDIRNALTCGDIKEAVERIKKIFPKAYIFTDNCYGEFVEEIEPTQYGVDIVAGSLIKNPGGGLAPTGGYITGTKDAVSKVASRLTAPGLLTEIGSYAFGYRSFFQGLFVAPHTVLQALKCAILASAVFDRLGFKTMPCYDAIRGDINQTIFFGNEKLLTAFIRGIQYASPVDSHVTPYAWDMPGYKNKVIMASGTFIQGASIELTADAPIKKPYCAYLQGALTYEHAKLGIIYALNELLKENLITCAV